MADDGDEDLQAFLRQHFGLSGAAKRDEPPDTRVLRDAQFIYDNSIDVALDMMGTRAAAESIYEQMQHRRYSPKTWSEHELHPNPAEGIRAATILLDAGQDSTTSEGPSPVEITVSPVDVDDSALTKNVASLTMEEATTTTEEPTAAENAAQAADQVKGLNPTTIAPENDVPTASSAPPIDEPSSTTEESLPNPTEETVNFIFTLDLLNFSFWSDSGKEGGYTVAYRERTWTGYWALVAAVRRALDSGIPITSPSFWHNHESCTDDLLHVLFRSTDPAEELPLLDERIRILRDAAAILDRDYNMSVLDLVASANNSAARLVNTLAEKFPSCYRDETVFEGRRVRFLKRAQIFVADLWACFEGSGPGSFTDIDHITMFADYRIPQILQTMGCLVFSPSLEQRIRRKQALEPGSVQEIEIRGCSIWSVEMIRRHISKMHPEAQVNAILLDFFLYDRMKEMEREGLDVLPHHRTRSVWY